MLNGSLGFFLPSLFCLSNAEGLGLGLCHLYHSELFLASKAFHILATLLRASALNHPLFSIHLFEFYERVIHQLRNK